MYTEIIILNCEEASSCFIHFIIICFSVAYSKLKKNMSDRNSPASSCMGAGILLMLDKHVIFSIGHKIFF